MYGGGEIVAGRGWLWVVAAKLWLVKSGSSKIMASRGWLWVVAQFSNALYQF